MKPKKNILLVLVLLAALLTTRFLWKNHLEIVGKTAKANLLAGRAGVEYGGLMPFAVDMARAEHDAYFGPAVPYDPNNPTLAQMRLWMLGFAKAMDNPQHPCNPLVTTNTKIIGINIRPLSHGDKNYTMWFSDGKTICGMEAVHFGNWSGVTFEGDFFSRMYTREWASGYFASQALAEEAQRPDKKNFWKEDIGATAHDMVVNAFGTEFLNGTLPQQYSGFFVSDGNRMGTYIAGGYQRSFFTPNIVEVSLKRDDVPPSDVFYANKFQMTILAEPADSSLAFKVVLVEADSNGFDFSKRKGSSKAVQLR